MSSTDKEKGMLKEWAAKSDSRIEEYDKARDSFWEEYENGGNISEFDFETVPLLKQMLKESVVGGEEVILPLTVAAFKKKDMDVNIEEDKEKKTNSEDFIIPEFIYVF